MRLFHKLFLTFALIAIVSSLAMAGVLAWNLQRGFSAYLDARDVEMLDDFTSQLEGSIENDGLNRDTPSAIRRSVEQMAADGAIPGLPPFAEAGAPPPPVPLQRAGEAVRNRRTERGPPPGAFGRRLRVFGADRQLLFGPTRGPAPLEAGALSRPIEVNGTAVASARLLPRAPTPRSIDARFLRAQYVGVAVVAGLLVLLSALAAWWLARIGVRRIAVVQGATNAIASGALGTRVDLGGRDEITAMGADINMMAESLERLEGARRRWLAEISHELRTPLTVLRGELEALTDGIRPMNACAVRSLSEEVARLNLLIDDLHFLAMSDLGRPPIRAGLADAVALVQALENRFGRAVAEAGLDLSLQPGTSAALPVRCDTPRIEQLLGNLLTNAVRYTDAPGRIRVALSVADDQVVLTVEDSAPGVPAEHLTQLFEPLHRLQEARDRVSGGSGLGLSVARAIVVAHGGRIAASPSALGGLAITIHLPIDARTS